MEESFIEKNDDDDLLGCDVM